LKKNGLLNKEISQVIAAMGHTDMLVICDAGFPVPFNVRYIDVSVCCGVPNFSVTVQAIAEDLCVEKWIIAEEIVNHNPTALSALQKILGDLPVQKVTHDHIKALSQKAVAVIRTGECTPYANVILVGGVPF